MIRNGQVSEELLKIELDFMYGNGKPLSLDRVDIALDSFEFGHLFEVGALEETANSVAFRVLSDSIRRSLVINEIC